MISIITLNSTRCIQGRGMDQLLSIPQKTVRFPNNLLCDPFPPFFNQRMSPFKNPKLNFRLNLNSIPEESFAVCPKSKCLI